MKGILKFVGGLILMIALIATIVYGGWIMINFIAQLIQGNTSWEMIQTHLQGIMMTGQSLAILLIGYIIGKQSLDKTNFIEDYKPTSFE